MDDRQHSVHPVPDPIADGTGARHELEASPLGEADQPSTSRTVLEWIGVLLPFTTVLTALAFWFGWTFTNSRSRYLGVDASVFEFSPTDFILRSADAIIVPIILVCLVGLVWLAVFAGVSILLERGLWTRAVRIGALVALVAGVIGLGISVWMMFVSLPPGAHYLTAPIVLGLSAASAITGISVLRRAYAEIGTTRGGRMGARGAAVLASLLLVSSLFWASTLYADALGRGRGMDLERQLTRLPSATVYSAQPLGLDEPAVETTTSGSEARYPFRYTGLRLMLRSADTYFLLPDGWKHGEGAVIVLHDGPELRFEFTAGS